MVRSWLEVRGLGRRKGTVDAREVSGHEFGQFVDSKPADGH